jgi:hypothetical protein
MTVIPEYGCAHVHMLHLEARKMHGECFDEVTVPNEQATLLLGGVIGVLKITLALTSQQEPNLSQVGFALLESLVLGWLNKRVM